MYFNKTKPRIKRNEDIKINSNRSFQNRMMGNITNTQNKIITQPKPVINDENLRLQYNKIVTLEKKLKRVYNHLNNIAKKTDFSDIYQKKKFGDFFNLVTKEEIEFHYMKINYNKVQLFFCK